MNLHLVGGVKQKVAKVMLASVLLTLPMQSALADTDIQSTPTLVPFTIENSQLVFDKTKSIPITLPEVKTIAMQIGESKAQEAARIKRTRVTVQTISVKKVSVTNPSFEAKRALAQRAAAAYNVPWEIVEAVWQIESGKSWDTQVRSYAGAQGPAQFMPATFRRYGVDGNGDGKADIYSAEDAVYSAANYLAANGANRGEIRRALFAYNHANWYVEKVLKLAREIGFQG